MMDRMANENETMFTLRRMLSWAILPFVLFAAIPVQAQITIVGNADVIVDGEVTSIPSDLAAKTGTAAGQRCPRQRGAHFCSPLASPACPPPPQG